MTFYTHTLVASQQARMNSLSLISLVIHDGGKVCDHLYVVTQENLNIHCGYNKV